MAIWVRVWLEVASGGAIALQLAPWRCSCGADLGACWLLSPSGFVLSDALGNPCTGSGTGRGRLVDDSGGGDHRRLCRVLERLNTSICANIRGVVGRQCGWVGGGVFIFSSAQVSDIVF